MKFYSYRGKQPNFGDELNEWLLPKVFPDFFDNDDAQLFLGIGSILYDKHPAGSQKIVFGSGFAGYTKPPVFDASWSVYCVRGPRTAHACGLGPDKVAGDSAILINRFRRKADRGTIPVSFIPHFQSLGRGLWEAACARAGIHLIDPRGAVEQVLADIEASELVIAEAMHGAIVADALRVPWIPVQPLESSHRFKWYDWAEAMQVDLSPHRLWPSSFKEAAVSAIGKNSGRVEHRVERLRKLTGPTLAMIDTPFVHLAAARLKVLARCKPVLSSDSALAQALTRLESSAETIRHDFASAPPRQRADILH